MWLGVRGDWRGALRVMDVRNREHEVTTPRTRKRISIYSTFTGDICDSKLSRMMISIIYLGLIFL